MVDAAPVITTEPTVVVGGPPAVTVITDESVSVLVLARITAVPAATPLTTPFGATVATAEFELDQVMDADESRF
jgi:hypothetical protein